jgi:hypothetical protein
MSNKGIESIAVTTLFKSTNLNAITVYWNGQSITTTAIGIDTQKADHAVIHLNVGTATGTIGTISNAIYVSQTNNPTTASALSGGSFNNINNSSGSATEQIGAVKTKDTNRYMFLRTEMTGVPVTTAFGATAALYANDEVPTVDENRAVFNV